MLLPLLPSYVLSAMRENCNCVSRTWLPASGKLHSIVLPVLQQQQQQQHEASMSRRLSIFPFPPSPSRSPSSTLSFSLARFGLRCPQMPKTTTSESIRAGNSESNEATRNPFGENMDDDKFSQETAYFYCFSNGGEGADSLWLVGGNRALH